MLQRFPKPEIPASTGWVTPPNWKVLTECEVEHTNFHTYSSGCYTVEPNPLACLPGQGSSAAGVNNFTNPRLIASVRRYLLSGTTYRHDVGRQWWRECGDEVLPLPYKDSIPFQPARSPIWTRPLPSPFVPFPQLDPMFPKPDTFQPTPRAIPPRILPGRIRNPARSPTEQPVWGNAAPSARLPRFWPAAGPSFQLSPQGQRQIAPTRPSTKVGTRTKEAKIKIAISGIPARIVAIGTEYNDVVSALYDSIPKELRGNCFNAVCRSKVVYSNFHQVDWQKFMWTLGVMQIEDRIIGTIGSGVAKFNEHMISRGVALGGAAGRKVTSSPNAPPVEYPWEYDSFMEWLEGFFSNMRSIDRRPALLE